MIGKLDYQVIEKFKEFQHKMGKYLDLDIASIKFSNLSVDSIFDIVRRGASPRPIKQYQVDKDYSGIKYNWLKIGDVTKSNIYLKETNEYINEDGKNNSVLGKKGDFLISNSMTVGVPIILDIETCFHDGFLYLGFNDNVQEKYYNLYLFYFFTSYRQTLISKSKDGIVKNLNTDIIKTVSIPIPQDYNENYKSIDIQKAMVEFLEYNFNNLDQIKSNIDKRYNIVTKIKKSLIPSTFKRTAIKNTFKKYAKENNINFEITDIEFNSVSFDKFFENVPISKKIQNKEFKQNGIYPIISQSESFINGYYDNNNGVIKASIEPVIIFGDHTTVLKYVDFDFLVGADGTKVLKCKTSIFPKYAYYQSFYKVKAQGYQRHFQYFKEKEFLIPESLAKLSSIDIQKILANFIDYIDKEIDEKYFKKYNRFYEVLELLRETYLKRTFSKIVWS
jgi:type I restriction enzyme S subunit